jgi:AraC family transcriptional regulator
MKVELKTPEFDVEPRMLVKNEPVLAMALRPGWVEVGQRRSEMKKINFEAGEMAMCDVWIGTHGLESLILTISDPALRAANDGISGDVELRVVYKLVDARLGALVAAVNAERVARFPSGRLFLDSIELALAVALVNDYAVRRPSPRIYRGGLTPARLRKVVELVHAEMDGDLSLEGLANAAGLSITHFSQMFRQSTGQSPHQFVLHRRIERAKEMLRTAENRVLDVAVACGFKSQEHFARVFRSVCGASPTQYRHEFAQRDQPSIAEQSGPFSNRSFANTRELAVRQE